MFSGISQIGAPQNITRATRATPIDPVASRKSEEEEDPQRPHLSKEEEGEDVHDEITPPPHPHPHPPNNTRRDFPNAYVRSSCSRFHDFSVLLLFSPPMDGWGSIIGIVSLPRPPIKDDQKIARHICSQIFINKIPIFCRTSNLVLILLLTKHTKKEHFFSSASLAPSYGQGREMEQRRRRGVYRITHHSYIWDKINNLSRFYGIIICGSPRRGYLDIL